MLYFLILQHQGVNNTASARHVVELTVDSELRWTDWFGFQGDDLTEEVTAPQGTLSCLLKFCFVWLLHSLWRVDAPCQAVLQTELAIYDQASYQHDAQYMLQICFKGVVHSRLWKYPAMKMLHSLRPKSERVALAAH